MKYNKHKVRKVVNMAFFVIGLVVVAVMLFTSLVVEERQRQGRNT